MRNKFPSAVALISLLALVLYSTACGDFFVSGGTLDHITLAPTAVFLSTANNTKESKQFAASAVSVNGDTSDVTGSSTWNTGNPATATADANGLVTAVAAGTTTVTAAKSGVTGTATVIVGSLALTNTLTVTPNNPAVTTNNTVQLQAKGKFSDNSLSPDWSNLVTWTTSDSSIATVSATGLVTGKSSNQNQTATITATIATATGTASGSVTVTVN